MRSWMPPLVALLLATLLLLAASPASGQKGTFKKPAIPKQPLDRLQANPASVNQVSDSVTNLAQKIARSIASSKSKTEIFSPVSIAGALSLLLLGAGGRTQQELLRVMGFNEGQLSFQEIHFAFGRLFQDLVANDPSLVPLVTWRVNDKCNRYDEDEDDDDFSAPPSSTNALPYDFDPSVHETSLANGVFLHRDYRLSESYRKQSEYLYSSEARSLDFSGNPAGSTKFINDWVSEKTHGKIPHILPTTLPPSTTMVLASAMYFRALWEETFIDGATKKREFYPDGKEKPPVMVDMMAHGGCFPFYESPELDARILGLPYKNRLTTMYVIMPNGSNREKLKQLIAKLNADNLNQMIARMEMKTTIILFPKMHVSNTLDLKDVLQKVGVRTLFHPSHSNLSAMVTETEVPQEDPFRNRMQGATLSPAAAAELRPTVNIPAYEYDRKTTSQPSNDLKDKLVFSRFDPNDTDATTMDAETTVTSEKSPQEYTPMTLAPTSEPKRTKRDITYKAPPSSSSRHVQAGPLSSKDFILHKRIVKEKGPVGKKGLRRRSKRAQTEVRNLYVSSGVHQIDLEINETGTEGGAATVVTLNRSGTSVVFRTEAPFLVVIRNDNTTLPLFYGAVYDPTPKDLEIQVGNAIFAKDGTQFDNRYNKLAKDLYKSELQQLDFEGNEAGAVRTINNWVSNETRGRIADIVSHISPDTIMMIVNTLYFRGLWEEPFQPMATRNRPFFPNGPAGESIDVPTMAKSGCMPFYHWPEENVRVLGIPYKQNVTMYILMPVNGTRESVQSLQAKISADTMNELITKMKMKSVTLLMPKMHVSNSISLRSVLEQLGVVSLFQPEYAELTRLLQSRLGEDASDDDSIYDILNVLQDTKENAVRKLLEKYPNCTTYDKIGVGRADCLKDQCEWGANSCVCCVLIDDDDDFRRRRRRRDAASFMGQKNSTIYVNEMLHKVDLTVNEVGTEGGAATATLIDRISSQVSFIVNGPYLMIIREETTRLPLFYGVVYSPK